MFRDDRQICDAVRLCDGSARTCAAAVLVHARSLAAEADLDTTDEPVKGRAV